MKKIKKILSLLLAVMMLSTMISIVPASACTVGIDEYRAGFNDTSLPLNGEWSGGIWDSYSCGIFNTYGSGASYATGKFGKSTSDAALKLTASLYTIRGTVVDAGSSSVRARFQMATDTNGGGGYFVNGTFKMKNAPGVGGDILFGVINGTVYVMGQPTALNWTHETWHDIDIALTFGNNSELSVSVDGVPVPAIAGQTYDGVKTTAWKLPIVTGMESAGDQFMRFSTYGGQSGFYIDNWILQGSKNTVFETDGKLFKSPTTVLSSTTMNNLSVANGDNSTKTLKDRADDPDGDGKYLELEGASNTYFYRNFESTGGQSPFRDDIMYSRAIEMNTYSGKTDIEMELCYPGSTYLLFKGFGNANAGGNYIGEAGKSVDALKTLPTDNEWHDFEWVIDNDGDGRGCDTLEVYFDDMPQMRYAGIYHQPNFFPHQLRVGFGSTWGVDNMRETLMKYNPNIKSATYTTSEGDATDDYAVSADVEKITIELTETIASADNNTVKIYDESGSDVGADVNLLEDNKTIELTLSNGLAYGTKYQIALLPELVCEDSNTDAGAWYQTLDMKTVYDFQTGINPFNWKKVELMTSYRSGEGTEASPYVWSDPAAYAGGYIGDNSKVGVKVTMSNTTGADKSAYVIVATYKDDELTGFAMVNNTFTAGESSATVMTNALPNTADMKVKAFVWDDIDFGVPYTKSFHLYSWDNSIGSFSGGTPSVSQ